MDILQLRAGIATLLAAELGRYTLPNGSVTPSISVRAEGENLPSRTTAEGLEVVIIRDPALTAIPQYSEAGALRSWNVLLVAWSTYVETEIAAAKLIYAYPGSTYTSVPVPRGTGPLHQTRITIPSNSIPVSDLPGPRVFRIGVFQPGVFV